MLGDETDKFAFSLGGILRKARGGGTRPSGKDILIGISTPSKFPISIRQCIPAVAAPFNCSSDLLPFIETSQILVPKYWQGLPNS